MKNDRNTIGQIKDNVVNKLGKVSFIDVILLYNILKNNYNIDLSDELKTLFSNDENELDNNYFENNIIEEYFDNLDVKGFVLEKVKFLNKNHISNQSVFNNYNISQTKILNGLIFENCVKYDYNDGEHNIRLTKRGELYLFLINNKYEVEEFIKLIKEHGYSDLLFDVFLFSQDLNKNTEDILKLNNFVNFITDNNRVFWELTEKEYGYKKVLIPINKKR